MVLLYNVIVSYLAHLEKDLGTRIKKSRAQKVLMMLILRCLACMRVEFGQIDFCTFFVPLLSFFTTDSENDPRTFCQLPGMS